MPLHFGLWQTKKSGLEKLGRDSLSYHRTILLRKRTNDMLLPLELSENHGAIIWHLISLFLSAQRNQADVDQLF
jgi:hypothetical protein